MFGLELTGLNESFISVDMHQGLLNIVVLMAKFKNHQIWTFNSKFCSHFPRHENILKQKIVHCYFLKYIFVRPFK